MATGVQTVSGPVPKALRRHALFFEFAGIVAILIFSFWAGMGPHLDYRYPLHVDEWIHIGDAQSMLDAGRLRYPSSYVEHEITYSIEMGFDLLLGFLKGVTGLSWLGLYRIAPGVLLALLAFLVYAFGRRDGFGWAAALFVPLIPTSIRTLGPAFLVPVSAAIIFFPVTLLVLHRMEAAGRQQSLWLLLILIGGTLFVHPLTEAVITALAALYLAALGAEALLARRYRSAMNLWFAVGIRLLIPAVVLGVWVPAITVSILEQSVSGDPGISGLLGFNAGFFQAFGIVAVALFAGGIFTFVWHRRYGLLTYVLPAFTGLLLWFLLFIYPRYLLGSEFLYERGWLYLGLFMAIFAGYGVAHYFRSIPALTRSAAAMVPRLSPGWIRILLFGAGIVVVSTALITGLASKERQNYAGYYHVVDDRMYADFRWIGQHTTPGRKVAIAETTLAWAYPPIAGPGSVAWAGISAPYSTAWADRLRQVFVTGQIDTNWLRQQGVSVLYTCLPDVPECAGLKNSDLLEVRPGVYLVPPEKVGEQP